MRSGFRSLMTALGCVACFLLGLWWGRSELDGLLATPPGGLYLEPRTHTVWSVFPDNPNILHYSRIPTPEQARMSKLFPTIIRQDAHAAEATTTVPVMTTTMERSTTTSTAVEQPEVWV